MLSRFFKKRYTQEEREGRAIQAKYLLENDLLKELLQNLENAYLEDICSSKLEQKELRERAYIAIQVLKDFNLNLQSIIKNANYNKE